MAQLKSGSTVGGSAIVTTTSGKAADSNKLDGLDSDDFVKSFEANGGVTELGRYIDLHTTNSTADYDIRLDCESANVLNVVGGNLEVGGNQVFHTGYGLGGGQSWQDVSGSRTNNVTYTNTTGKPIEVLFWFGAEVAGGNFRIDIGGLSRITTLYSHGGWLSFIIPAGNTYLFGNGGTSLRAVWELR